MVTYLPQFENAELVNSPDRKMPFGYWLTMLVIFRFLDGTVRISHWSRQHCEIKNEI